MHVDVYVNLFRLVCDPSVLGGGIPKTSQMAARARMISAEDVTPDCARISTPTLIVTGERHLDHVVVFLDEARAIPARFTSTVRCTFTVT